MAKIKATNNIDWLAAGMIIFFTVAFAFLSFGRHDSLKSYLNDLGTYDQVVWNTLQGHWFENSANMLNEPNYLGAHFSPILIVFVPFYKFLADPKWLLFFQSLSVGLGAIPIYLLARQKWESVWGARIILLSYFLFPYLQNGILYDFHEVVLAVGFAAWAFYFLEKEKYLRFLVMAVLLALCQEHLALLVLMMGLYVVVVKKKVKLGSVVAVLSLAYFVLVMFFAIPHFSSGGESALIANNSPYPSRYAWLGKSFPEVIRNLTTHPLEVLKFVASQERFRYVTLLIAPVFGLALLSWSILIIVPLLAINLLSSNGMTFNVFFYHSAIFAPFIFMAAILGLAHWFGNNNFIKKMFFGLILAASAYCGVVFGASPLSFNYHVADFVPDAHARKIAEVQKLIPEDASLSVQHNLGPHFSERRWIYRFPLRKECANFIILDTTDPYRNNPKQMFNFEYALQMSVEILKIEVQKLKTDTQFEKVYDQDGYLIFKNNNPCKIF
jgi:uncharacterized membrane protein